MMEYSELPPPPKPARIEKKNQQHRDAENAEGGWVFVGVFFCRFVTLITLTGMFSFLVIDSRRPQRANRPEKLSLDNKNVTGSRLSRAPSFERRAHNYRSGCHGSESIPREISFFFSSSSSLVFLIFPPSWSCHSTVFKRRMIAFCTLWIICRPCAVLKLQGGRPVLEQSLLHTVPAEVLILHYPGHLRSSRRYGGKFNYTCDDAPGLQTPRIRMTKTYGMILENCSRPSRKHGKWVAKGKYWYALSTVLNTTAGALWSAPGSSLLPSWLELEKQHMILCSTCHILKWLQSTTTLPWSISKSPFCSFWWRKYLSFKTTTTIKKKTNRFDICFLF